MPKRKSDLQRLVTFFLHANADEAHAALEVVRAIVEAKYLKPTPKAKASKALPVKDVVAA